MKSTAMQRWSPMSRGQQVLAVDGAGGAALWSNTNGGPLPWSSWMSRAPLTMLIVCSRLPLHLATERGAIVGDRRQHTGRFDGGREMWSGSRSREVTWSAASQVIVRPILFIHGSLTAAAWDTFVREPALGSFRLFHVATAGLRWVSSGPGGVHPGRPGG